MKWFRYVRWEDVPKWERLGWALHRDLGVPHNHHAVLMIWTGEGEPA
jgi:hypothetical protein